MRLAKLMMTVAAASLVTAPALASSSAAKLSVSGASQARAATVSGKSNKQGGLGGYLVPAVIVVALGLGLYFAFEDDGEPASP